MNFDYNEEQQLLADSVRRYLEKEYGFEARKKIVQGEGWSPAVWKSFADMGLMGLPLPADHGGFGGGAVDLMGVVEAFGEALVVEPYVPTIVAARLIARGGSDAQKRAILPAVAEGGMKLALAHDEKGARYRLDHVKTIADNGVIEGEKCAVVGAPQADRLVVSARTSKGVELFVVEKAQTKAHRTLDEMLAGDVTFNGVKAEPLAGGIEAIEEAIDFATALACAEAVGAMKFACDTTLEYLKTRKQFGVPIGTFQALQHRMVEMFIAQEQAKSMACLACSKVDSSENARDRARSVSMAKVKIADNARHVSQESVQLHGGMGMTEELKVSHTFRRLTVLAKQYGDADHHLARLATL